MTGLRVLFVWAPVLVFRQIIDKSAFFCIFQECCQFAAVPVEKTKQNLKNYVQCGLSCV
jgi:hypothetical protein